MYAGRDRDPFRSAANRRIPAAAAAPAGSRAPRRDPAALAAAPRCGALRQAECPRYTRATTTCAWRSAKKRLSKHTREYRRVLMEPLSNDAGTYVNSFQEHRDAGEARNQGSLQRSTPTERVVYTKP